MTATHVLSDNKEHDQSEQEEISSTYVVYMQCVKALQKRHVELNVPPVLKYSAGKVDSRKNLMKFKGQALMRRAGDGIKESRGVRTVYTCASLAF